MFDLDQLNMQKYLFYQSAKAICFSSHLNFPHIYQIFCKKWGNFGNFANVFMDMVGWPLSPLQKFIISERWLP